MIGVAAVVGIVGGTAGFYLSYYLDVPSGAAIVLTMSALFAVVYALKGLITWLHLQRHRPTVTVP
jgi:manganese/iron transport system permease protein